MRYLGQDSRFSRFIYLKLTIYYSTSDKLKAITLKFKSKKVQKNRYEVLEYNPVTNETDLTGVSNRSLLRWWLSFSPEIPKRSDFDILDHISLAPDIFLVQKRNETSFEFRIHGESANRIFDDKTGKIIRTDGPSDTEQEREETRLAQYYHDLTINPVCIRNFGNIYLPDKEYLKFESLDCPLVDETSKVTHIIGTITPLK